MELLKHTSLLEHEGRSTANLNGGRALRAMVEQRPRTLLSNTHNHILVLDYMVYGSSLVEEKPRPWSDKQLFYTATSNIDLAPDSKRFAIPKI